MRQVAALREVRSTYGTVAALQWVVNFVGHKLVALTVVRLVWLDVARLAPQDPVTGFDCRFLGPEEIRSFSRDPANDLSEDMADRAAEGHVLRGGVQGERTSGRIRLVRTGVHRTGAQRRRRHVLPPGRGLHVQGLHPFGFPREASSW